MKKVIFSSIIIAFIAVCGWKIFSKPLEAEKNKKPTIKIGVTLPLTGDVAWAGQPVQKAIALSLKDMQKEKNLKYNYELIFEDDHLDNKNILLNYSRFKSINKVNAVMSMWGNAVVISEPANRDQVLHWGCSWGYEMGKGLYNFNHSTLPDEQVGKLLEGLKAHDVKKLGLVYNTTKSDYDLVEFLKNKLKEADVEVAFENIFQSDQKDFKIEIAKMKEAKADAIFLLLVSPGMEIFMKQANELDYHPQYTSINYFSYNPQLFEGQWYVSDAIGTEEFREHFAKETGEKPDSSCAANLYSALQILIDGFENTVAENDIPTNKDVAETILNMGKHNDATGETYIDDDGNVHGTPTLNIIKDGRSVVY